MQKTSENKQPPIILIEQLLFGEYCSKEDILRHHLVDYLLQQNCEILLLSKESNIENISMNSQFTESGAIQISITESCECQIMTKSYVSGSITDEISMARVNNIVCIRNEVLPCIADNTRVLCVVKSADYPCVFRLSDIVFASKQAATYCNAHHISHHQFSSLYEVLAVLKSRFTTNNSQSRNTLFIPTKRQAELYRKASFEIE